MLCEAYEREQELNECIKKTLCEEKYKYFHCGHNNCCLQLSKNDPTSKHFISVNSDNKILGYICYEIHGISNIASGLSVINFSDEKLIFGKDLIESIDDIFRKFKYRKLEFSAVVGNPIIDNYDKLCLKYGGKIVGVRKGHYVIEGKYYDEKMYEIMREEYLKVC